MQSKMRRCTGTFMILLGRAMTKGKEVQLGKGVCPVRGFLRKFGRPLSPSLTLSLSLSLSRTNVEAQANRQLGRAPSAGSHWSHRSTVGFTLGRD